MTKVRVKTKEELVKEFGSYNGQPRVPAPSLELQGKVVEVSRICSKTGDAVLEGTSEVLDRCVFEVEKNQ